MAKQTFTTGQVLTAAQMTSLQQTAMGGGSTTAKTTSYILVAADAGTTVAMNAAGSTTITVNTSLFSAGDSVFIQNWGAGTCTVTAGTATVTTHGSLALSQWEGGTLYFTSSSAAIFFDISQSTGMTNPMTTTGDTIYSSSGSTPARLGIGTTGQVLTVAGGVPSWATASSGGGMTLIETLALTSGSSVTSSTIAGTYTDLQVVFRGVLSNNGASMNMRINGDTGSNYFGGYIRNDSGTISGAVPSETTWINLNGASATSAGYRNVYYNELYIKRYADSNFKSVFQTQYMGAYPGIYFRYSLYNSSSAITSLTMICDGGNFTAGNAYIYGVK
jgi:hypothetical protein